MVHTFDMGICEFGASPSVHISSIQESQNHSMKSCLKIRSVLGQVGSLMRVTATGFPV